MRFRSPGKNSPFWTPKEDYRAAVYWCRRYPLWLKELETLPDTSKGIDYSTDKVQTSNNYDATADTAIRRSEILAKVTLLEGIAKAVMPECPKYLIRGVTEEGVKVEDLINSGMPFGKNLYLRKRQQFYHLLAKRI